MREYEAGAAFTSPGIFLVGDLVISTVHSSIGIKADEAQEVLLEAKFMMKMCMASAGSPCLLCPLLS